MTSKIITLPESVKQPITYPYLRQSRGGGVILITTATVGVCVVAAGAWELGEYSSQLSMDGFLPYDPNLTIQLSNAETL